MSAEWMLIARTDSWGLCVSTLREPWTYLDTQHIAACALAAPRRLHGLCMIVPPVQDDANGPDGWRL